MRQKLVKTGDVGMMIRVLLFLFLLLLLPVSALDIQVGPEGRPEGAVIVVVDGLGASYVYPEHSAYALDGSPLAGSRALQPHRRRGSRCGGEGSRPGDDEEPQRSHHRELRCRSGVPQARQSSTPPARRATSAWAFWSGAIPCLFCKSWMPFSIWATMLCTEPSPSLDSGRTCRLACAIFSRIGGTGLPVTPQSKGCPATQGYNAWGLDAAADIVEHLPGQPFIMLVNVGAVDSAGQNLGADGYLQTVQALDAPLGKLAEACRKNNVLLVITADHGMVFPSTKGKGGHSAEKYAAKPEALRVPLVFFGPGVEELNLGGRWSEMDIAPTVLDILNISSNLTREGRSMPLRESYDLRVLGAPAGLELWRGEELLANGSTGGEYNFRGLARGLYTLKAGGSPCRFW